MDSVNKIFENHETQGIEYEWTMRDYEAPSKASLESVIAKRNENSSLIPDCKKAKLKHIFGSCLPIKYLKTETSDYKNFTKTFYANNSDIEGCTATQMDTSTTSVMNLKQHTVCGMTACYTGRADTKKRIEEQLTFMFDCESKLSPFEEIKGMKKLDDNTFEFTYAINTLTKLGAFQSITGINEKESLEKEIEALKNFSFTYNGKTVAINPILLAFNFSKAGEIFEAIFPKALSGKKFKEEVYHSGADKLIAFANCNEDESHLTRLISLFKEAKTTREQFILADQLQKACGLLSVHHCKSSVDRAGVAIALSAANTQDYHEKKASFEMSAPSDEPLTNETRAKIFNGSIPGKETFFRHLQVAFELTKVARFGYNPIKDEVTGKQKPGLKMNGSVVTSSLPNRFVNDKAIKLKRHPLWTVAKVVYIIAYPLIVAFMITVGHLSLAIASIKWKNLRHLHAAAYLFNPNKLEHYHGLEIDFQHPDLFINGHNIFAGVRQKEKSSTQYCTACRL